ITQILMKLLKTLIIVFVFLSAPANAKLTILSWEENSQLTLTGKISEIVIKADVSELPENMAMSSFSIVFDPTQNITIKRVVSDEKLSDEKNTDYSFNNNALNIKFPNGKKNGEAITIYFSYAEKYDKIHQFLRQEAIYVPAFAAGAKATVTFNFPGYFESATFNPNLTKKGNSFVYSSIVPPQGVREFIKLTPSQSTWEIALKTEIKSEQSLGKIVAKVPIFFQSAHQKVDNYQTFASVDWKDQKTDNNFKTLSFDTVANKILIINNAKITTGTVNRRISSRDPKNYINVTLEEASLLSPILQQIKNEQIYSNIPLYAKIGKFVHEYLKYDISYLGRLPNLQEIVRGRVGVCTEYARLYDALARLAGIPSIIIDGAACGEYQECQGHSWNMIYHEGNWIEVDPTWDLMSGIVSSSHVYFNDNNKGITGVEYFNKSANIKVKIDLEMNLIDTINY
ncbi:MAG: transglutaminase domain-containing protein, partial [Rickettsiales bacterium]|nr:transglutaminase domain-containing protein [Rickettsiales bacterium]